MRVGRLGLVFSSVRARSSRRQEEEEDTFFCRPARLGRKNKSVAGYCCAFVLSFFLFFIFELSVYDSKVSVTPKLPKICGVAPRDEIGRNLLLFTT